MSETDPRPDMAGRISLAELEDLYEHAPCGYLTLSPSGRIERANATFCKWTGFDAAHLCGQPFSGLLNLAGKVFFETHFAPLLRLQGQFNEVALDMIDAAGRKVPVLVNALERRDDAGQARSIRLTVFNATDRRRYERDLLSTRNALSAANQDLRQAVLALTEANQGLDRANRELTAFYDRLPLGLFRANSAGQILQASGRFCQLLGIERPEDWLNAPALNDGLRDLWLHSLTLGQPLTLQLTQDQPGTPLRHLVLRAIPVPFDDGELAYLGVLEDVTDERQAEGQRQQIERFTTIRQLTGGLAHNLNNILMVIMGNMEALEDQISATDPMARIVASSMTASERASALVRRLLLYAGYSTSRVTHSPLDQTLTALMPQLTAALGPAHHLETDLQAGAAEVALDSQLLFETLREVLDNAVAAQPEGGAIRLTTRQDADAARAGAPSLRGGVPARPAVVIRVIDQGIGMDAATLAKAREPFFTRQGGARSVGLGLSLVDGVCRILGGSLALVSQPGQGTTVSLHLPQAPDQPAPPG